MSAHLDDLPSLQRRTVRSLATAQVVGAVGLAVIPSVGVLLAEEVTTSEVWAGLARTGTTLGAAVASLPLAALAVRHGRRPALALGWGLAAVGSGLLVGAAQLQDVVLLLVGLVLTGAGVSAQLQARFAATDLADPARRGRALATVVWVGALGSVVGPNLGTPGAHLARWLGLAPLAGAFVVAAVALAAAAVVVLVLLRPDPLRIAQAQAQAHAPASASAPPSAGEPVVVGPARRWASLAAAGALVRADPAVRTAVTAVVSAQVAMVAVMTMTPVHLHAHGSSLTVIGLTISLHVAGMFALAPVAGWLSDRAGPRVGIGVGLALFAGCFALAVAGDGAVVVTVALVLLGLGWSFTSVAGSAWLSSAVPTLQRARVQGGTDAASNVAAAVGAFASGPVLAVLGFGGLALVAAAALVPLCWMLATARRPSPRPQESAA